MKNKGLIILFSCLICYFLFRDKINAAATDIISIQPRGIRNNNPGNIILSSQSFRGEIPSTDQKYKQFMDMKSGLRAIFKILNTYFNNGYDTNRKIAFRWSNESGKKLENYIEVLGKYNGKDPDTQLNFNIETMMNLVQGIVMAENGRFPDNFYGTSDEDGSLYGAMEYYKETING